MEGRASTQDLISTSVPALRATLEQTVREPNTPASPTHAPMEGAAQKLLRATSVSVRQAGAARPAPSMLTTALPTRVLTEEPAKTWLMATSATAPHSGWGRRV